MIQRALAVALVALAAFAAVAHASSCTVTDAESGEYFDLSALTRTSGDDWKATGGDHTYYINVCHQVLYAGGLPSVKVPANTGIFQERTDALNRTHVVGLVAEPSIYSGLLVLNFTGGENCDSISKPRSALVTFSCDEKAGIGAPVFLHEVAGECWYLFEWKTSAACPASSGLSGAAIFCIIMVVLFTLYCLLGFLYKRFVAGAQGWHQVPNYHTWAALFGLCACCPAQKPVQYRQLNQRQAADPDSLLDELQDDEFDDDAEERVEDIKA